jgi:hypothetical protein
VTLFASSVYSMLCFIPSETKAVNAGDYTLDVGS